MIILCMVRKGASREMTVGGVEVAGIKVGWNCGRDRRDP
jgi:hypothetical protein